MLAATVANASASLVVPVSVKGWTLGAAFSALQSALLGTVGIGALVAWIKTRPKMREIGVDAREKDMAGLRADIVSIKADAKEAKDEARRVSDIAQRLENMVACMRPAISILTAEVKRLDPGNPNNPALVQVQELMAMAAAGDLGMGKAMMGLSTLKGVGE